MTQLGVDMKVRIGSDGEEHMNRAGNSIYHFVHNKCRSVLLLRKWVNSEAVGLNGQKHRKRIFCDLVNACAFDAIVETGTFKGDSAAYMAQTASLPVYTSELSARFTILARIRLRAVPNIKFFTGDSREFLKRLPTVLNDRAKRLFLYLDAHWYADLPLEGELDIICQDWRNFVIMIDDFQVPGDEGYGYDSYDAEKTLSFDRFSHVFQKLGLVSFFPNSPSSEETGVKRGCVVLARERQMIEILSRIPSLCREETRREPTLWPDAC